LAADTGPVFSVPAWSKAASVHCPAWSASSA